MPDRVGDAAPTSAGEDGQAGPYILCGLQVDPPLSSTATQPDASITCVEFWNDNLYIGTSATEILHYVLIPPDPSSSGEGAKFTFASRSLLSEGHNSDSQAREPGVQQIQILPRAGKAGILWNGFLSFYTLPELSPAAFAPTTPIKCAWIGGLDLDAGLDDETLETFLICQRSRINLVDVEDQRLRKNRSIELPGCVAAVRRSNIACVADSQAYSLVDIVERNGARLFDISTIAGQGASEESENSTPVPSSTPGLAPPDLESQRRSSPDLGHQRSASLGASVSDQGRAASPRAPSHNRSQSQFVDSKNIEFPQRTSSLHPRSAATGQPASPATPSTMGNTPIDPPIQEASTPNSTTATTKPLPSRPLLKPNIVSPTPGEFLLTTGTSEDEPGVGMFVNLDGDPVRGTIGFSSYPQTLVVDGRGIDQFSTSSAQSATQEGFLLAVVSKSINSVARQMLEIQRWDVEASELGSNKHWLTLDNEKPTAASDSKTSTKLPVAGVKEVSSDFDLGINEVVEKLAFKRLGSRTDSTPGSPGSDERTERTEIETVAQLSTFTSSLLSWCGTELNWVVRNPMVLRLDAQLLTALKDGKTNRSAFVNRRMVEQTINTLRGQDAQAPLEFYSFKYIRQKASLALFMDLLSLMSSKRSFSERDRNVTEESLSEGEIDPRIVLTMLPILRDEVVEGKRGIWIQGGIRDLIYQFLQHIRTLQRKSELQGFDESVLQLIKRYLFLWRQKKGLESVQSAREISQSVDAALLHLLLILDSDSPRGPGANGSIRWELNLVVDKGIDCFERGVELLEKFNRLYVLSRLYQAYRMSSKVLSTWRRILDGEQDDGGEFKGVEQICSYLTNIQDESLVREYGVLLANKDPRLGVRVFGNANGSSKVKFEPEKAIEILKSGAPNAVKVFIEHLVFERNLASFANTLISYYLDSVLSAIENDSSNARSSLADSYSTYRSLQPPKPTYSQFVADNTPEEATWARNRLRLLQLLGGSHGAASQYDVPGILSRIQPYADLLIPETIVLAGRQGQHHEAIRLLTHGLGDLDTAIRYCVMGGSGTYSPTSHSTASAEASSARPGRKEQEALFAHLLSEFFKIEDDTVRIRQTSELLERFAGWFDVEQVLDLVPDSWSVDVLSSFLQSALRQLRAERNETAIQRALTSVDNLNVSAQMIEKLSLMAPVVRVDNNRPDGVS